jgi:hypothetical protein
MELQDKQMVDRTDTQITIFHEQTDKQNMAVTEREVIEQVRALYEQSNSISYSNQEIFELPVDERVKQSNYNLEEWIRISKATIKVCKKKLNDILVRGQTDMWNFFTSLQNQTEHTHHDPSNQSDTSRDTQGNKNASQYDLNSRIGLRPHEPIAQTSGIDC